MHSVSDVERVLQDNLLKKTKSSSNPERTLARQFKKMDLDGSATVSFTEFKQAVEPFITGFSDELVRELFDSWDADHSGELTVSEFVQGLFKSPKEREKLKQEQKRATEASKESSVRADDIIEQAKQRRAERLKKDQQFKKTMAEKQQEDREEEKTRSRLPVRERLAARQKESPNQILDHQADMHIQRGAFRSYSRDMQVPDVVRYRVSSTWVSCSPPATFIPEQVGASFAPPKDELELEFVYGHNPAAGIATTDSGLVIYAAAGLGVVYDPRKHSQRFFRKHTDDVTCIALDPSQKLVASGQMGKDPALYVWEIEESKAVARTPVDTFERQVTAVAFSHASPRILAAIGGDNHHMMVLFDWVAKTVLAEAPTQNGIPPQINCIVFDDENKSDSFVTCGFKHLKFWSYDPNQKKKIQGGRNATYGSVSPAPRSTLCAAWLSDNVLVSGGSNGNAYIWDALKSNCIRSVCAHDGPVKAILVAANDQIITAGGTDKALHYWSTKESKALHKLEYVQVPDEIGSLNALAFLKRGKATPILVASAASGALAAFSPLGKPQEWKTLIGGHMGDLYGLATHPSEGSAFVTAGEDGVLNVWDAASCQTVEKVLLADLLKQDVKSVQARSCDVYKDLIAVGLKDGSFCVLRTPDYQLVFKAKHCLETIDEIRFSPDGKLLAVGSHDNFIDIYDVEERFEHLMRLKGHTSFITHLDWSSDSKYIQSNCGAYERLVWDGASGQLVTKVARREPADVHWDTHSCILGFDVMGIWQPDMDGTDINSASRSNDLGLLATGDDSGIVRLHRYPVLAHQAPAQELTGHSSHVMNVRWLADSTKLISVGGHDRCVLQWNRVDPKTSARNSAFSQGKTSQVIQPTRTWKPQGSWK